MATLPDAAAVAQRQLELYNARDLDPYMDLFAADVVVSDAATGAIIATSAQQLRPRYAARFQLPVHCELLGRLCLGDTVVDREVVTGLPDNGVADCLATYTVRGGRIVRVQLLWQPR